MELCIVMAGSNVHGRIIADAVKQFRPVVINEVGTPRAEKLSKWLAPDYGPTLSGSPVIFTEPTPGLLSNFDYAINGGWGLIKEPLLSAPRKGWLNAHPGLLPEFRGAEPVLWALSQGSPQGATVHLLDEGLDTGPILIRRQASVHARSVLELRLRVMEFGASLLAEFLADPHSYPPIPQDTHEGSTYSVFCNGDHAEAERRLGHLL